MRFARLILLVLLVHALGAAEALPISIDHGVVMEPVTRDSGYVPPPALWYCAGFVIACAFGWVLLIVSYSRKAK